MILERCGLSVKLASQKVLHMAAKAESSEHILNLKHEADSGN